MKKSNRGAVQFLPILIVCGVCWAGVQLYRVFAPGRNKDKISQVAESANKTKDQATEVENIAKAVKTAVAVVAETHKNEIDAHKKVEHNAAGFVTAASEVLVTDLSDEAMAAKELQQAALDALGETFTPEELARYSKLAKGLLAKNVEQRVELERLRTQAAVDRATIEATAERAKASEASAKLLAGQNAVQATNLVKTATVNAKLTNEVKTWADGAESAWDRVKALGWLSVAIGLVAVLFAIKFFGTKAVLTDVVALGEHVKAAAVEAGHDAGALEQKIHTWWEGHKNESIVAGIKSKVLRQ